MLFRGELRSPGQRSGGAPVVLRVDDFNLEITSGGELLGRWFLGDVEVKRLVADRFALYLGEDEAEFAAEDALQFAYDGVAAMQQAWVKFKKNQRRHRKAAAEAARNSDRERGRSAKAQPAPPAISEIIKQHAQATEVPESAAPPQRKTAGKAARQSRRVQPAKPVAPPPSTSVSPIPDHPVVEAVSQLAPPTSSDKPAVSTPKAGSRIANLPTVAEKEIKLRLPSQAVENGRQRRVEKDPAPPSQPQSLPDPVPDPDPVPVRLAPEGHHPQETNKPLRSLFRKEPKLPEGHVHRYEESATVVGLRRRVCVECAYVSIAADGD